jgi:hypothetical protein
MYLSTKILLPLQRIPIKASNVESISTIKSYNASLKTNNARRSLECFQKKYSALINAPQALALGLVVGV